MPKNGSISMKITLKNKSMNLGAFSISLNVKDIHASKAFYETLGFIVFAGDLDKNYLIMKSGTTLIGLFQGMFDANILTFNPGWDENANTLKNATDVRDIQKVLKQHNIPLVAVADESTTGPANCIIHDPDGNMLLFDQHI